MNTAVLERAPTGLGGLFYGVYPATVTDLKDPDKLYRIQVKLPWLADPQTEESTLWARVATLMAGPDRGTWFMPDVDDEVLVMFEAGDPRRPYIVGALWNGKDAAPQSMDSEGQNNFKIIQTRKKIKITLEDTDDQVQIIIETPGKQVITMNDKSGAEGITITDSHKNTITLDQQGINATDTSKNTIAMTAQGINATDMSKNTIAMTAQGISATDLTHNTITMASTGINVSSVAGNSVKVEASGITVTSLAPIKVQGAAMVQIQAPQVQVQSAMIQLEAAMVQVAGVIQCSTLIAPSIVGSAYTPGGGNIL